LTKQKSQEVVLFGWCTTPRSRRAVFIDLATGTA